MKDLVLVSNFEVVECNFELIEEELRFLIADKYNIVVTEDSVKEAKATRADINKGKKALEQAWRSKKAELEAPIKDLNEKAKRLFAVCDEAILKIDVQVNQFESKKKELAVKLCGEYRDQICSIKGIDPNEINVSHLNNLGYVTEKGSLSSSGKQVVDNLIIAKVAEIAEKKQRELEVQMEIERIRQDAISEYRQRADQNQYQEPTQEPTQEPCAIKEGKAIYRVNVAFCFSVKGVHSENVAIKVRDFVLKEISLNDKLKQSLQDVEVVGV